MILKQNETHKAIKRGQFIDIVLKGITFEGLTIEDNVLFSIRLEDKEDLFYIFEQIEEETRVLTHQAKQEFKL